LPRCDLRAFGVRVFDLFEAEPGSAARSGPQSAQ
jgi:hypothetical protein